MDLLGDDLQTCIIRIDRTHLRYTDRCPLEVARIEIGNACSGNSATCARYEEAVIAERSAESSM